MSNLNCSACSELNDHASEFVQNGVTETVCTSLKNNTGFNPSLTTIIDDCEDLDLANDCLIGMMAKELDMYDICDWKEFMKKFIPNVNQVIKAGICAMCGLWDKVECITGSITKFSEVSQFAPVSAYQYFYDWRNINTASNPASPVTTNYNFLHSYVLLSPGSTVVGLLNSVSAGGIYPNQTVGGYTYSGIPVYEFTGNLKDANILGVTSHAQITTDGRFTYEVVRKGAAAEDGTQTFYVSIRSRIADEDVTTSTTLSFFWNEEVVRQLDFYC